MRPGLPPVAFLVVVGLISVDAFRASADQEGKDSPVFLDRHGVVMRDGRSTDWMRRERMSLGEMSPWLVLATLAAEDKRFLAHPGIDLAAIMRAAWSNLKARRVISGGSTITQQVVRVRHPRSRTFRAKVVEAAEALRLERHSTKHEILETYLNTAPYGPTTIGVGAASRALFGKSPAALSLAEAAYLAALPQAPTRRDYVAVRRAQGRILVAMHRLGWIDDLTLRQAVQQPIVVHRAEPMFRAQHAIEYLAQTGQSRSGPVRTTLDADLQEGVEAILRARVASLKLHRVTNAASVVIENATGDILAWVGSVNYFDEAAEGGNDGVLALRQPGSALKPFVYGLALERGWRVSDLLLDLPTFAADRFTPRNYDEKFHGPLRIREALACSYNVPAIRLAEHLGAEAILDRLHALGCESLRERADHYGLGLALGNGEITLLELAGAYAALARGGVWRPSRLEFEATADLPGRRVFSEEVAYLLTHILSDNSARAAAFGLNSPLRLPFSFAAKTGTTKDYRDSWAVGVTPEWTVGVWMGNFSGVATVGVSGARGAADALKDIALLMWQQGGASEFPRPAGLVARRICPLSGAMMSSSCPTGMTELFLRNFPPSDSCVMHGASPGSGGPAALAEVRAWEEKEESAAGGGIPVATVSVAKIVFPRDGDAFQIDPASPLRSQALRLRAIVPPAPRMVWRVDGRVLAGASVDEAVWWPIRSGTHTISIGPIRSRHSQDTATVYVQDLASKSLAFHTTGVQMADTHPASSQVPSER